ncbi:MAG: amidohydrolase family protein [Flavobacteriales bacterium]|nr:amidohydrolase family protein [Flavobacteriales bacterium]
MRNLFLGVLCLIILSFANAQQTFHINGVQNTNHNYYAFINAVLHVNSLTTIENATLLIKNGKVEAIGQQVTLPANSVVVNLNGKHIYPSFIDLYSNYGITDDKKETPSSFGPQYENNRKGAYNWNQAITPEQNAFEKFSIQPEKAKELQKQGFGAVLTHKHDGIMRGSAALVMLGSEKENIEIINNKAAQAISFSKGSSTQAYPSSLMGTIALIRQTYYDAEWYAKGGYHTEFNIALEALNHNANLPVVFDVRDKLSILRADKIAKEFNLNIILKGNGDEYQRVSEIKITGRPLILPLNFPKAYETGDAYETRNLSLKDLKHWELAPYNLKYINDVGIEFCITSFGLEKPENFLENLRLAVKKGLPEQAALKALTETPAKLLNVYNEIGSLEVGKKANFILCDTVVFSEKAIIYQNWINGKPNIIKPFEPIEIEGTYDVNIKNNYYRLSVSGKAEALKGSVFLVEKGVKTDTNKTEVAIKQTEKQIAFSFTANDAKFKGLIQLNGNIYFKSGIWEGMGQLPDGEWIKWTAIKQQNGKEKNTDTAKVKTNSADSTQPGKVWFPNIAYGLDSIPAAQTLLVKNATVWTNEKEGVLKETDVLIQNGKIVQVAKNILPPLNAKIVDASGKHITPGIIDEHSHIAISAGVNEGAQSVTAEVSIADVVNSDDVNIYRQLAGGVTAAQLLHGSANCIGGQSAIIKLRWGKVPEEMKVENADGFIKFALGENVKQSNWGDFNTIRFPQTRMGVEQVYYNAFIRAKEYEANLKILAPKNVTLSKKQSKKNTYQPPFIPVRKDIELDVLLEILNQKRFITCHSYVQSEINMLMHVADSMGFKVNTFTHILEGYKVADKMKTHGVGGSTFSDWWAYKFEVNDAIPYNAALLHSMDIVTAINSDDAEMGRRLNQEAAKAVKYGGISEEEALKLVTLNPAKLLHLDHRIGTIKSGKDADLVIWSGHPLSIYSKVEKTLIDGIIYFDIETDVLLRKRNEAERVRILQKMNEAKNKGAETQKPKSRKPRQYHCDTLNDEINYDEEL